MIRALDEVSAFTHWQPRVCHGSDSTCRQSYILRDKVLLTLKPIFCLTAAEKLPDTEAMYVEMPETGVE